MPKVLIQTKKPSDPEAIQLRERRQTLYREIEKRAYGLFQQRGPGGSAMDDWLRAERELVHRPVCSLIEEDERYFLCAVLPGVGVKQVRVTAMADEIVIQGDMEATIAKRPGKLHLAEMCEKEVFRCVEIPGAIDASGVAAALNRGVLEVKIPKRRAGKLTKKTTTKKTAAKKVAAKKTSSTKASGRVRVPLRTSTAKS